MNSGYEIRDMASKGASGLVSASEPILARVAAGALRSPLSEPANESKGHLGGQSTAENLTRLFAGILTGDVNASIDKVRYALQRTREIAENADVDRPKHDRYAATRNVSYTIQVIERDQVTASVSRREHSGRGWNGKHHFAESKRGGRVIHAARVLTYRSTESEI